MTDSRTFVVGRGGHTGSLLARFRLSRRPRTKLSERNIARDQGDQALADLKTERDLLRTENVRLRARLAELAEASEADQDLEPKSAALVESTEEATDLADVLSIPVAVAAPYRRHAVEALAERSKVREPDTEALITETDAELESRSAASVDQIPPAKPSVSARKTTFVSATDAELQQEIREYAGNALNTLNNRMHAPSHNARAVA